MATIRLSTALTLDELYMRMALEMAEMAQALDEVPVGAVLVFDEKVVARGYNRTRLDLDPTAHAEVVVLRQAARILGNYRLTGATLYSSVEPCPMCAGALVWARVARLVYGTADLKAGAVDSQFGICASSSLNHKLEVVGGVLEEDCRALMQRFFRARRRSGGIV